MSTGVVPETASAHTPTRRRKGGIRRREAAAGWLFTAPVLVILGLFLAVPVLMALWVSVSDWTGRGSPFSSDVGFIGADNYRALVAGGLTTSYFGVALKNIEADELNLFPGENRATSATVVTLTRPGLTMRGRGLQADFDRQQVSLLSDVHTRYVPTSR